MLQFSRNLKLVNCCCSASKLGPKCIILSWWSVAVWPQVLRLNLNFGRSCLRSGGHKKSWQNFPRDRQELGIWTRVVLMTLVACVLFSRMTLIQRSQRHSCSAPGRLSWLWWHRTSRSPSVQRPARRSPPAWSKPSENNSILNNQVCSSDFCSARLPCQSNTRWI